MAATGNQRPIPRRSQSVPESIRRRSASLSPEAELKAALARIKDCRLVAGVIVEVNEARGQSGRPRWRPGLLKGR